jgi:Ras-related protein Rab-7A
MADTKKKLLKIVIIGDSGVGKTSLLHQYNYNTLNVGHYTSTIGADYSKKDVIIDDIPVTL